MKRLIALIVLLVFGSVAYADYEMSDSEKERYLRWAKQLKSGRDFALAVAPNGCYRGAYYPPGFLYQLRRYALANCYKKCKSSTCRIMDVNGTSAFIKQRGSSSSSSTASTVRTLQIGGGTYIGDVVDGRANGQGTLTWASGAKYVGQFKDSKQHGQGTYTFPDGYKYVGEWKDDKQHGQGTYTGTDGHKYVGEYKNGKRWKGIKYNPSDRWQQGTYSVGHWCSGCNPNQGHRTLVAEINSAYKALIAGSGFVWCATANDAFETTELFCRDNNGKEHPTKALAQAEHQRLKEAATPVVKTATLTLRSNVKDDRVYIDGDFKGSTRLALDLPKGQHTIRIEKDGYEPYEETVNLTDNLIIRGHLAKVIEQPAQTTTVQPSTVDNTAEIEFWKSIKDSNDRDMYRAYIDQFPEGVYVSLAKIKLKTLGGDSAVATIPDLAYGDYYALVIGNNQYQDLTNLRSAVNDAKVVSTVLEVDYGFNVKLLENASRKDILRSLKHLRQTVSAKDNVLIYYAGHGYLDKDADYGYWLPVDSERDDDSNWIATDKIVSQVKAMKAKHVMVVADSCFSGTITRAIKIEQRTPEWLAEIVKKKARTALTSGGLEPVMDTGSGNHSAFAYAFISLLKENDGVLDASQLFSKLRPKVMVNSTQTPQYGKIHMAGDDGGDFLFVRQ